MTYKLNQYKTIKASDEITLNLFDDNVKIHLSILSPAQWKIRRQIQIIISTFLIQIYNSIKM